jgi:acetyl esterase/lipase
MLAHPAAAALATTSPLSLTGHFWLGLVLVLCGALGLFAVRAAMASGSVAMLDRLDWLLAAGDRGIRLASAAHFGDDPAQRLQLFVPADPRLDPAVTGRALPLVVFIHGGAWVSGDPHDYRFVARNLAPAGHAVLLAGYRLGVAGRYPAMLEDGAAVLRWIASHATALGADPTRVVLMGHSAGAYNAVMLGLDRRWLAASGLPARAICGIVGLAGPYDFLPLDDPGTIGAFGHADDLAQTQPVNHVLGAAPPLLLIHGADDRRVLPRHSLALARAMARCGASSDTHVLDAINHEGLIMRFARPFLRDRRALALVTAFLARVTTPAASAPVHLTTP